MEEREFVEGSRQAWDRLAGSVEKSRKSGVSSLAVQGIKAMHDDYRRSAADLAYAQTHFPGSATETYLNRLVGQAHAELYGSSPRRLRAVWTFLARDYPRLVRSEWKALALAAGFFVGALALGYLMVYIDYPLARLFLPAAFRDGLGDSLQRGRAPQDLTAVLAPTLSAAITVNNIQVSLTAMAGGMTFGVLTAYMLSQNGAMLGVLAAVFAKAGLSLQFWALIVPHGSLELPAIVIAGTGGLIIGRALLSPGDLPRSAALGRAARKAARLVLGCIPLFVIAGFIEGFITPRSFDPVLKVVFGVALTAALAGYLALAGRKDRTEAEQEPAG